MNPAQCNEYDSIHLLISTPGGYSGTQAARVPPEQPPPPAEDAWTRWLYRLDAIPAQWGVEAEPWVQRHRGLWGSAEATVHKPDAPQLAVLSRQGSGPQQALVQGINLIPLRGTDGDRPLPWEERSDHKVPDPVTPTEPFLGLMRAAQDRGFTAPCVAVDSGYSSLTNLKAVRNYGGTWRTQLKAHRLVSQDHQATVPVSRLRMTGPSAPVHRKG